MKKVKKDLLLIKQARLGFQVNMANQDSVVHLVPLELQVSTRRGVENSGTSLLILKITVGKTKWKSRLREWNRVGGGKTHWIGVMYAHWWRRFCMTSRHSWKNLKKRSVLGWWRDEHSVLRLAFCSGKKNFHSSSFKWILCTSTLGRVSQ